MGVQLRHHRLRLLAGGGGHDRDCTRLTSDRDRHTRGVGGGRDRVTVP